MNKQIIPQHTAYPRTFVSQRTYKRADGSWTVDPTDSDDSLNEQLEQFVKQTGNVITQVSAPNVNVYSEGDSHRVYITSVSVLYIPAEEGSYDRPRDVDAQQHTQSDPESVGDIHRESESKDQADDGSGDGGGGST